MPEKTTEVTARTGRTIGRGEFLKVGGTALVGATLAGTAGLASPARAAGPMPRLIFLGGPDDSDVITDRTPTSWSTSTT